ncbi:bifunctional 3'-5' exonuclease/DNA polymerase [Melissospora conviva]|uniref:bifunctional 3'-5' exonuclease/DNA polymerase n=1 Tax=Melissospora conviva TaxID=3388432 RepID=UPI003C2A146C
MSYVRRRINSVLTVVAAGPNGGGVLRALHPDGSPAGPVDLVDDLVAAVAARQARSRPRWIWAATAEFYPRLLAAGVRVDRCHDLELTEALLLGHAGHWGEPRSVAAAYARLHGRAVPPDPPSRQPTPPGQDQPALFAAPAADGPRLDELVAVHADQLARIGSTGAPGRFRMLVAAESAGALIAVEMAAAGLPWRADVHDDLLRDLLGEPSPVGGPPRKLAALAARIAETFGLRQLQLGSPGELLKAFAQAGIDLPNTRSWSLRAVDHPAVPLLLEYKELYRIWTAHGWAWRGDWVRDGRFRPEYVPAGVVSGRWATRGGGALQIPKVVRRAVVADPGRRLVVADAGQLEPRVLAAVSGDARLAAAGGAGDLYAALARDAFGGDRARAKLALLGAMYGQTGGAAVPALAVLRQSYPTAFGYVEAAARTGAAGGLVRSWLGRTCPPGPVPPDAGGSDPVGEEGAADSASGRARGRFTRNFVIQATAAEWALTLMALVRTGLAGTGAELVFFQHDEVVVDSPAGTAAQVAELLTDSANRAGELLFGASPVRFPLDVSIVDCYADAA